jgi:hypothetical protein
MIVLEGRDQIRQCYPQGENLMNTADSKSTLLNNSFSSKTQANENKICNALGCYELAFTKLSLKIDKKSITIFGCKNCKTIFEN